MAVTINKEFWNSTNTQFDTIAKVVFTSPNIDSPALAGTRSHILPGSPYISTWYEAVDYMHRINNSQETFNDRIASDVSKIIPTFISESYTSTSGFDFNSDASISLKTNAVNIFTISGILYHNDNNYATIETIGDYSATTSGISLTVLLPDSSSPWVHGNGDAENVWWTSESMSRYEVVDIYISYNNGNNWSLVTSTSNDGSASIIPTTTSTEARVKVVYDGQESVSDTFSIIDYIPVNVPNPNYDTRVLSTDYLEMSDVYNSPESSIWFDGSDTIYKIHHNTKCTSYKYTISTNNWTKTGWSSSPTLITDYSSFTVIGTKVYVLSGNDTGDFWEYNTVTDQWLSLRTSQLVINKYSYLDSLEESDTIYAMCNGVTSIDSIEYNYLYKYTISTDLWEIAYTFGATSIYDTGPYFWKHSGEYYTFTKDRPIAGSVPTNIDSINIETGSRVNIAYYTLSTTNNTVTSRGTYGAKGTQGILVSTADTGLPLTSNVWNNTFACNLDGSILGAQDISDYWYSHTDLFNSNIDKYPHNVVASGTNFYLYLKSSIDINDVSDTYMYRYTTGVSGLGSQCYLPGNGTIIPDYNKPPQMTVFNNNLYIIEATKTNNIWYSSTTSGEFTGNWQLLNYSGLSDTTYTDDIYFVHDYSYITSDPTYLYYIEGFDTYDFYRGTGASWTRKSNPPGPFKEYFNMDYHAASNSHYAIQGLDSRSFWKYNVSGNSWSQLEDMPEGALSECSLKVLGDYVYVWRGVNTRTMWKFDINTPSNGWISIADYPGDHQDTSFGITISGTNLRVISQYDDLENNSIIYNYDTIGDDWLLDNRTHLDIGNVKSSVGDGQYLYLCLDSDLKVFNNNDSIRIYTIDMDATIVDEETPENYSPEINSPPGWYAAGAVTSGTTVYNVDLSLSNVTGTAILQEDAALYNWIPDISSALISSNNTIVYEVTNGEAYNCRLTAWDDETHTTTDNKILSEGHYKVACLAYKAGDGTKLSPVPGTITDFFVHPPESDLVLKGNDSYYGDFDLIYVANGGSNSTSHGEYLIFQPMLDEMDDTFTSGNYDFITTLHYQYT